MGHFILQTLEWFGSFGYAGIVIGLAIEVIPSEIVLGFAGYLVQNGDLNYWLAVLAGTIGGVVAQLILYALGRYGGRPFVDRFGKYLLIKPKHVALAETWFQRYGNGVVFSARFIPVVRHAISIPAGMVKMNVWKFTLYTAVAAVPWSMFFIYIGMKLGQNWSTIKEQTKMYTLPIIAGAFLIGIIYMLFVSRSKKKKQTGSMNVEVAE